MAEASGSGGAAAGGTFRLGTSSRIDSLNPYVAFNQDAYSTFEYIYPLLIQYDGANAKFVPDFADPWKSSDGGKTWTFKTRPNAKWSDGKPMTAEDAAWTINTDVKYTGHGRRQRGRACSPTSRTPRRPTRTRWSSPTRRRSGTCCRQFQQLAILPKHIWSQYTGTTAAT